MKRCYVPINTDKGHTLGIAEEDIAGYYPLDNYPTVPTYEEAWTWADQCNTGLGIDHDQAVRILCSSMRAQNSRK